MILFFLQLISFLHMAQAQTAPVIYLNNKESVIEHFCLTEEHGLYNECGFNQHRSMSVIYFPQELGEIVVAHINESFRRGYHQELSKKDLFHGHSFLKGPQTEYKSVQDYFADLTASLYHSAEYNHRWEKEKRSSLSIEDRTPRSFIGWLNGALESANDLIQKNPVPLKSYEKAGTIYSEEIQSSFPEISFHSLSGFGRYPDLLVHTVPDLPPCRPQAMFYMIPDNQGRFTTAQGQKIEIFVRCFYR